MPNTTSYRLEFVDEMDVLKEAVPEVAREVVAILTTMGRRRGSVVRVVLDSRDISSITVADAHQTWRPEFVASVETPWGLPRQTESTLCPPGAKRWEIQVREAKSGGMGSFFGYVGAFCSVIVDGASGRPWDVRCQAAT